MFDYFSLVLCVCVCLCGVVGSTQDLERQLPNAAGLLKAEHAARGVLGLKMTTFTCALKIGVNVGIEIEVL